jgi:hypothetical protein
MLADGTTPIIFPLRERLQQRLFLQQRPRSTAGRRVVVNPVLPWAASDQARRGNGFGRVDAPPILAATCWPGYGLSALAMASSRATDLRPAARNPRAPAVVHQLMPPPVTWRLISGITLDASGAPLPSCAVELFLTRGDVNVDQTVSGPNGVYSFKSAQLGQTYYIVAYKAGSPDVAGTTVNTLTPV